MKPNLTSLVLSLSSFATKWIDLFDSIKRIEENTKNIHTILLAIHTLLLNKPITDYLKKEVTIPNDPFAPPQILPVRPFPPITPPVVAYGGVGDYTDVYWRQQGDSTTATEVKPFVGGPVVTCSETTIDKEKFFLKEELKNISPTKPKKK